MGNDGLRRRRRRKRQQAEARLRIQQTANGRKHETRPPKAIGHENREDDGEEVEEGEFCTVLR